MRRNSCSSQKIWAASIGKTCLLICKQTLPNLGSKKKKKKNTTTTTINMASCEIFLASREIFCLVLTIAAKATQLRHVCGAKKSMRCSQILQYMQLSILCYTVLLRIKANRKLRAESIDERDTISSATSTSARTAVFNYKKCEKITNEIWSENYSKISPNSVSVQAYLCKSTCKFK